MFRNKYKYSVNHGLLPVLPPKPYHSPILSVAITNSTETAQYQLHPNPSNPNTVILFNDR
jgi:hypothetical protein